MRSVSLSKIFTSGVKYKVEVRHTNNCKFEESLKNAMLPFENDLEALVKASCHIKRIFDASF